MPANALKYSIKTCEPVRVFKRVEWKNIASFLSEIIPSIVF